MTNENPGKLGRMQRQVLGGLAAGRNMEQLSAELDLSELTIGLIAQSASKALNASSIPAAVATYVSMELQ